MPSIADVYVTILPETSRVADGIRSALRSVDDDMYRAGRRWGDEIKRGMGDVEVDVDADTAKAKRKIDDLGKTKDVEVDVDADTAKAERKIDALERRRRAKIDVDVDRGGGLAGLSSLLRGFTRESGDAARAGSTLGESLQEIGKQATYAGRGLLTVGAVPILKVMFDVGRLAVTASQSIALLPAVAATAAAGIGTLKIATQGFGDAMDGIRDPEKFATALQSLSPNAQQAALSIQNLIPEFDKLKAAAQDSLFAGVSEQLNQLANQYLPTIQSMTTNIATSFNTMFSSITAQLMTPETQVAMQTLMNNITATFQALQPAMGPITQAITQIMSAGSDFLPGLATSLSNALISFSNFIDKATADGSLHQFMQDGIDAAGVLMDVVGQLGGILYRVFALDGPEQIGKLRSEMQTVVDVLGLLVGDTQTWSRIWNQELMSMHGPIGSLRDAIMDIPEAFAFVVNKAIDMANTVNHIINTMAGNAAKALSWLPGNQNYTPIPDIPHMGTGGDWGGYQTPPGMIPRARRNRSGQPLGPAPATGSTPGGLPTAGLAPPPRGGFAVPPPPPPSGSGGGAGATPSSLVPASPEAFWDAIAAKEAGGNWQNADTGGTGHYGGLQFSPETWAAFGGKEFAPMPHQASREQQMIVADRTAFSGYNGKPPQGLGAWEVITKGMVAGVTTSTPSPGTPFAAGSAAAASSAGYPDTSGYTSDATPAMPQDPRSFAHDVMMPYWQQQGLTVGDHEADQYGEHQHGALDIMVPDIATGEQVLQQVLSDPNVYGAIFNKQSYGYGHGATGKPYTGANPHTDHVHAWYKPGASGNIAPGGAAVAAYPDMGGYDMSGYSPADYSGYKSIRDAGEKVSDTEARIGEEQAQLDAMRVKSGVTPEQIAKQEREVAKAKREHRDALEDLTIAQNKYNDAASKSPDAKGGFGADFGKDFMGGILEFFGFDGSLFKNPADFGLMKLFGGFSKLKPRGEGGAGLAPGDTGGGGSGLESFFTSIIPQPFGPVTPGASSSAPGQFLPNMPGSDSGGIVGRAFAPAGVPGPGNAIDNSITINNPVGQDHLRDTFDQAMGAEYPKMRQPMRSLPR